MHVNLKLQFVQSIILFLVFATVIFIPAGTLFWAAGWIFLLAFFSFYLGVTVWLFQHNPGLMEERMRAGASDQQGWEKLFYPMLVVAFIVWLGLTALDSGRLHWSYVPAWLQVIWAIILLGSFYFLFLTFRENSYLSSLVRVQEDRGHTVVTTGPYHYIRHPMYAALLVFVAGASLLLASFYGLLIGLLLIVVPARRAVLEEYTLRDKLEGYSEYMTQVKYRIIPHIW